MINIFNAIPIKIPIGGFIKLNRLTLKDMWKYTMPRRSKILLKVNKLGELALPCFKIYYKALVNSLV